MKLVSALLLLTLSANALADTEAEATAAYNAQVTQSYQQAASKIKPGFFAGVPAKAILSGGSIAYSIARNPSSNPYAIGTYLGAASSMLPFVTDATLSSVLDPKQ